MCSFMRDERGVTEPFTDIPALGIVAVGLILFAYLMLSAYSSYAASAYYAGVRGDLRNVAHAAAADPSLTYAPYTFDARKLDNASVLRADYGYQAIRMTVDAPGLSWSWGRASSGRSASCSLPVSVRLGDARCVTGTLKVTMWER
jgi:hypothetical protein